MLLVSGTLPPVLQVMSAVVKSYSMLSAGDPEGRKRGEPIRGLDHCP